jgi:hypothetical protein
MSDENNTYNRYEILSSAIHYDPFNEKFSREDFETLSANEQKLLIHINQQCLNHIVKETQSYVKE